MKKYASNNGTCLVFLLSLGYFFLASSAEDVFKCPEQFGYYPDMDDCTKYFVCVFGDSLHEKCTGGLFFSVELQTCDWPRNVECANGMKPGEIEVPEADEIFSSSRRTTSTATGDPLKGPRPATPNPVSLSNDQHYEEQETREISRNTDLGSQGPKQISRTPAAKTPSPTLPPQATQTTTQSSTHQARPTIPVENGPIPSTVSKDVLYASDEQSKESSQLDNYDIQPPEYDEAVPPIVDSEGRIHIADNGHVLKDILNSPLHPSLISHVDLKQPRNCNSEEGTSHDGSCKNKDRNRDGTSLSQSTRPRSLESGLNSGHSNHPDVVIDFTIDNKRFDGFNNQEEQRRYPTPSIFDGAVHVAYERYDEITPARNSNQGEKNTVSDLSDRNARPPLRSNNGHSKDPDVKLNNRNTDRKLSSGSEYEGRGNEAKSANYFQLSDYGRLNQNGDILQSVPLNPNSPADNRAVDDQLGGRNPDFETSVYRILPEKNRNTEYASADDPIRSDERELHINPNANVDFDTIGSTNNGDGKDADTQYPPQKSQNNPFGKEYSHPENQSSRPNKESPALSHRDNSKPQGGSREQSNQNSRENNQREQKQNRHQDTSHTLPAINSPTKDVDASYVDVPSNEDFGVYTGQKNFDGSRDAATQGVMGQPKAEENSPPQQSNNQRVPVAKDYPHVILDTSVRDETPDHTYEQFDDFQRGYEKYDPPKRHFTEDYYTNEDLETTTRTTTTAKPRTRPTRPRRTTTTPTTTTTTSTTPAPIRIRTRKPLIQATRAPNKPAFVATTPASPPYRPSALFPTPSPLSSAQKCDPRKCRLPDCRCGGTDIPGEFTQKEIPQIVLLTFDDAVNDLNHDLYNELFNSGRANPNGCPILGTFYVSHEWTDYGQVQTLYSSGHEIASHSITHSYGEKFTKSQWLREIHGQREILHLYGGVKMEDIRGMRAPFLQIGGNRMFEMLYDANFTYDSSMPVYENDPPFWPYSLDYALGHECMIFPCPTKSFPGLWEVGMIMWVDLGGGRCSMGDACSNPADEESVMKMLLKNFNRHYKSNRAPFGLFYHSAWFNTQHHRRGFMKFLDEILKNEDVWLVTNWQAIEWIRNPTPLAKIKDFEPFDCRKLDRPPPCPNPTVCNVWYQGGVRYMKTCQPCPAKYPWVGSTGYDNNNRGRL